MSGHRRWRRAGRRCASGRARAAKLSEPRRPGRHRRIEADDDLDPTSASFWISTTAGRRRAAQCRPGRDARPALDMASAGFLITEPELGAGGRHRQRWPRRDCRRQHRRRLPAPGATSQRRSASGSLSARSSSPACCCTGRALYSWSSLAVAYAIFELTRAIGTVEARPPIVPLGRRRDRHAGGGVVPGHEWSAGRVCW